MQRLNGSIYLIDDDQSVRSSLAFTLRDYGYVVHDFGSAKDFLEGPIQISPAVILMEMRIPDMTGLELQKKLISLKRHTPVIFISSNVEPEQIVLAMKNGAVDFLFKPLSAKPLIESVSQAMKLDAKHLKTLVGNLKEGKVQDRFQLLSPREKEVCHLLVKGLKSKEVAEKLGVTPSTVKIQKSKMMKKMNTSSLQELTMLYTKNHLEKIA